MERVKPNTVIHYHAVIHRALKYAVKTDLIDVNPADKVDRPKKNEFTGNFYSKDEMNALFDAVRGSKIEVAVMLTAFYGLRRSEVVGLKWAAVDFEQNTIEICHTVTTVRLDGKEVLVESNDTKTKSSKRTLPLVPVFRERLLALQEEQKENRKLCGRCYNKKYADYICVDAMGNLLKPDYLSNSFQIILQNYHLRRIRFHDLRHTAATNMHQLTGDFYTVGEVLGHTLAGIGVSLGLSMNFEAVTARYVDVRLERKKEVLDAYHGAVKQADPAKAEKAEPKKAKSAAKKKSSDLEL